MKPPPFEYVVPDTVADAVAELALHDGDARPLAGGQTLIPMMNFRVSAPSVLVDLRRIPDLSGIEITPSHVRVGAMARTARLLDPDIEAVCPVVTAAARLVAHPQIRNRGTVGGSIANADPAAELPAVALLTGASIRIAGPRGARSIAAERFFKDVYTTDCEFDEIVVGVDFPTMGLGTGFGFREFARRPGDFAVAGVGALIRTEGGVVSSASIVCFGLGPVPVRVTGAEDALRGKPLSRQSIAEAVHAVEGIEAEDAVAASASFKRRVACSLAGEVLDVADSALAASEGGD
jgi:aerobic carbon-monoxide dehydrogenase medium subunit